jgi:hypothetical protein
VHCAAGGFCQAAFDRDRNHLDDIFGLRADDVHAQDLLAVFFVDDFDQAFGLIAHARCRIMIVRKLTCFGLQAALESLFLRPTDLANGWNVKIALGKTVKSTFRSLQLSESCAAMGTSYHATGEC